MYMHAWPASEVPALPGQGRDLRIHDTATGGLVTLDPGPVARIYVCGITPYDATHMGHAATYNAFDLVQRVWLDTKRQVHYVQNVTDVDDPLLERAIRDGLDWRELAERETELFRSDMTALRVLAPAHYVGAVEAIPQIVDVIARLEAQGATYQLDGDIYFSISSDVHFGDVGHLDRPTMLARSAAMGGDPERVGKKDPLDPMLWRAHREGEPCWESPYGPGRPGWHVECAAIAMDRLGDTIDVQGGGSDLVFPHHECSASHAQVATGQAPFATCYAHAGMVAYDGAKMSKSLGNLVLVSKLRAAGAEPAAIRLAVQASHWRSNWEWTAARLEEAEQRLARWRQAAAAGTGPDGAGLLQHMRDRLADDLDAPGAIAAVDDWAAKTLQGEGDDATAPALMAQAVDALLGIEL
jgi:L-cysteine:1D-myo-inositol 2-amino-2-deoxy-alpha-D-glucopyranoside ligase